MPRSEKPLDKFYNHIDMVVSRQLEEMDKRVRAIDSDTPVEEIVTILSEANSLISFIVGDDEDSYEQWRYRLFRDVESGKIHIIQGDEIDVDFRGLIETGRLEETNEDEYVDDNDDDDDDWWNDGDATE